ncbi:MAG: LysR family transcriptional regulator [Burkholderiales bacterium]|nr:LysR family transcriptional regulator [Burkholderiales bacterium]
MGSTKRLPLSLVRSLKLHQLAVFDKVAESGSVIAASRELAMSQPAVSKSLHELERYLGEPLFVRGNRGVTLTPFGGALEYHAKAMLAELRRLGDGIDAWKTGGSGRVAVGSLLTASATLLPETIVRLHEETPDVTVEVHVGTNASLFPALGRGDLDIVIGFVPELNGLAVRRDERVQLVHSTLYDEELCVFADRGHALARRRKLTLRELHALEWILPTPDSVAYRTACAMFAKEGLELPRRVVYSVSVLANVGLLTRRPMVALMPRSAVEPFVGLGAVGLLPLGALGAFGTVGYTLRADREARGALQRFIVALEEVTREGARRASRRP